MENKDFEKEVMDEQQEEIVVEKENETEKIKVDEIKVEEKDKADVQAKFLDENEKLILQLKNKISLLYKICAGIVIFFFLALFILNSRKNSEIADKEKTVQSIKVNSKKEVDEANRRESAIQSEYVAYKTKMQPYENMEQADKEKREAEIKAEKEKKEAEEKAKKEAEEKAKKEEEAKGYETGITYEDLARNPDDNKGKKVTFKGKVVQVIRGDGSDRYRIAVNDDYKKMIYVEYVPKTGEKKILENDKVVLRGISAGEISYKSTMGGKISIPGILADSIEIK